MTSYLGLTENKLQKLGGYWTAREISQQPASWRKTIDTLKMKQEEISLFLDPIIDTPNLRIILTGAGTSAFIGESIASTISTLVNARVEAIATTDLVSNPDEYLHTSTPTLLISFARSGNSPESVAAVEYAESRINNCYQLAITCNKDGHLFKTFDGEKRLALLMPEETNDKSLAMTSSFSSMLLAALFVFTEKKIFEPEINKVISACDTLLEQAAPVLKELAEQNFQRVIYLGSGPLRGLSRECALKLLELTDGKVISSFDSPLGFRHGPKAIVNKETLVIVFLSNQAHTRQYDLDIIKELENTHNLGSVVSVGAQKGDGFGNLLHEQLKDSDDIYLVFPCIVWAQMLAFYRSVALKNEPDSPSSSGTINRVVEGVRIYPLNSKS